MSHLIVMPIVLPLAAAVALLLTRFGNATLKRGLGLATTLALLVISVMLLRQAASGEIQYYALGNWQPPFGIIMVLDRLSALMLFVTSMLAVGAVLFACGGDDEDEAGAPPLAW